MTCIWPFILEHNSFASYIHKRFVMTKSSLLHISANTSVRFFIRRMFHFAFCHEITLPLLCKLNDSYLYDEEECLIALYTFVPAIRPHFHFIYCQRPVPHIEIWKSPSNWFRPAKIWLTIKVVISISSNIDFSKINTNTILDFVISFVELQTSILKNVTLT